MRNQDTFSVSKPAAKPATKKSISFTGLLSSDDPFRPQKHLHIFRALGIAPLLAVLVARFDERAEQRMRLQRLGLELGMELAAQEIRMVGNLYDLHVSPIGRSAGDAQSASGQHRFIFAVELIAVAMSLADL